MKYTEVFKWEIFSDFYFLRNRSNFRVLGHIWVVGQEVKGPEGWQEGQIQGVDPEPSVGCGGRVDVAFRWKCKISTII